MKLLATDAPALVHGPVHSRAAELPLWLVDPATTRATNENAAADGQGVTNDSTHLSHMTRLITMVELRGLEPLTSSMPWKRATSCAKAPRCGRVNRSRD